MKLCIYPISSFGKQNTFLKKLLSTIFVKGNVLGSVRNDK